MRTHVCCGNLLAVWLAVATGMWPAAAPAAVHFVRPGAVRVEALSTDTNVRVLAFGRNGRMTVVLINGSGARAANIVNLPVGAYGLCQFVGGSVCQELSVQAVAAPRGAAGAGVLAVTVPANTVMTVYPYAGTNQPPVVTDFKATPDFLTLTAPGSATTPATGLTVSGEYVFAVTIHDGVNSVTRNVVLNVHADNEPLFPFDVHNRLPVTMTLPINNTELRCAAIDLEGDPLTYRWSVLSQPAVAAALLASPAAAACPVTNMTVPGDYVFQVKLSDPSHTVAEKLIVTVDPPNPSAPTIMDAAAAPATLTLAVAATRLSATSRDPDGSHAGSDGITLETLYEDLTVGDVSYWSIVGLGGPGPGGSSISISTTPPSAGAAPIGSTAKLLIFS